MKLPGVIVIVVKLLGVLSNIMKLLCVIVIVIAVKLSGVILQILQLLLQIQVDSICW